MKRNIARSVTSLLAAAAIMTAPVGSLSLTASASLFAQVTSQSVIVPDVRPGEAISDKLNEALLSAAEMADDNKTVTVRLPAGTYFLDSALHIYSNTTLDATGCTLISDESKHNLFILGTNSSYMGINRYNSSEQSKGYTSVRNVTVKGGVWEGNDKNTNTPIRLAHATNVTFENMTVRGSNMSTHQVEAAGIDGFYVRNCTFCDFTPLSYKSGHFEAIQLDVPINTAVYNSSYLDGTPNKNVEITGCTFSNVSRGVGTHSMLVGAYHSNIKITDNTFINVQEEAIVALNYLDCRISGNKIVKCGGGIIFESAKFKPSSGDNKISSMHTTVFDGQQEYVSDILYDMHSTIFDNDIDITYSLLCSRMIGIRVHGLELDEQYVGGDDMPLPITNYYISGVNISNNRITTEGGGILLDDARDIICQSNSVVQTGVNQLDKRADAYDGIYITTGCQNISVLNNNVSGFTRHGILVCSDSVTGNILSNEVSACGKNGIYFTGSTSSSDIRFNKVTGCGANGIALASKSSVRAIVSNTVSSNAGSGISVSGGSVVTGGINSNIAEKSGEYGIALSGSKSSGIDHNTVVTSGSSGIYLYGKSTNGGKITSNSISGTGTSGVMLDKASTAASITSNTVSSSGSNGIYLNGKSTVKGSISGNTVQKTVQNGISLTSGSKAEKIASNKVSTNGKNGIFVYSSSKVDKGITKNTVSGTKRNGILIDKASSAESIISNKVSKSGQNGIYLYNKSSLGGDISGNTIKDSKQSGIALDRSSKSAKLTSNKISSSGKNGIYLYSSSRINGISDNTVKSSSRTGIALGSKSTVKTISSNTVTSSKVSGISLLDKSSATGGINKNRITSAGTGIYADKSSKVKGKLKSNEFDKIKGKKTDIKK